MTRLLIYQTSSARNRGSSGMKQIPVAAVEQRNKGLVMPESQKLGRPRDRAARFLKRHLDQPCFIAAYRMPKIESSPVRRLWKGLNQEKPTERTSRQASQCVHVLCFFQQR